MTGELSEGRRRGRAPKPHAVWLRDQLRPLLAIGDSIRSVHSDVAHNYGLHTGLKLAAIRHAADVFSTVAYRQVHGKRLYQRAVYMDLFAGCGINLVSGSDYLAGTPFIPQTLRRPFDEVILVESDPVHHAALSARMAAVNKGPANHPIIGNCNAVIGEALARLGSARTMAFVVVDQEKLDAAFSTLQRISEAAPAVDFAVTLPRGIERVVAAAVAGGRSSETIETTVGISVTEVIKEGGSAAASLVGRIGRVLGRNIVNAHLVRNDTGGPSYDIQVFTRNTPGGSEYKRGYEDLIKRLDHLRPTDVLGAVGDLRGTTLFPS